MPDQPLVSIIIPTYNRAHLIGETLDSVLAQTYINWECIVVDDGSTDGTSELLKEYCNNDSRFQYHHRPTNRLSGGNAARNYGFDLSKGDYINWFDSDDLFEIKAIEKKIRAVKSNGNEFDYVLCGFKTFGTDNNIEIKYNYFRISNITKIFVKDRIIFNTPSFLYSRKIVEGITFNENLTKLQDLDFVFRVLKNEKLIGINIPEILIKTRIHEQTITFISTKDKLNDVLSELQVWRYIYNYSIENTEVISQNIALVKCLRILKKIMIKKEVILFMRELSKINKINIHFKLRLIALSVLYFFLNKGDHAYNILLKKSLIK